MKTPLCLLLLVSSCALADTAAPRYDLTGFATLGVVRSDRDDYRFRSNLLQDSGAGSTLDPSVDSVFGLQGTGRISDTLDFTVQAVTRKQPGDTYTPQITWAFLRYRITPALTLRTGRTRTPFFMFSDALNVNYITPWVRPPIEVYALNLFSELDGGDLLYRYTLLDTALELQAMMGNSAVTIREGSSHMRNTRGLKLSLARGNLNLQFTHARAQVHVLWRDPFTQFLRTQFEASGNAGVMDELSGEKGKARFSSAGFQWEEGNWLAIGEYVQRRADRYMPDAHGWYFAGGHRSGPLMPYFTIARQTQDGPVSAAELADPRLAGLLRTFNASRNKAQASLALGARWDAARNLALKAQLERIKPAGESRGSFLTEAATTNYQIPPDTVHVLSVSLDFVF
ncbi:hypothetical protein [Zoogloea sp.]|uniref:hypothetical protein n=1 Tax=Zoogloea sp. TaxID=49181 RepID=UPI0026320E6A|nr:hypothetical protein [Zoogloea sp.]MDD3353183.1 hypothetical protein [Zoogloea sp.]